MFKCQEVDGFPGASTLCPIEGSEFSQTPHNHHSQNITPERKKLAKNTGGLIKKPAFNLVGKTISHQQKN